MYVVTYFIAYSEAAAVTPRETARPSQSPLESGDTTEDEDEADELDPEELEESELEVVPQGPTDAHAHPSRGQVSESNSLAR